MSTIEVIAKPYCVACDTQVDQMYCWGCLRDTVAFSHEPLLEALQSAKVALDCKLPCVCGTTSYECVKCKITKEAHAKIDRACAEAIK